MKKEFVKRHRVLTVVTALLLLMILKQPMQQVQAAAGFQTPEKEIGEMISTPARGMTKIFPLYADVVTQIPKYIVEKETVYVLDESDIVVEETGRSSSEGANVITTSVKVESLPDNDLERIEKTMVHEGTDFDLLYVVYEVTEEDEDGIPIRYSAVCEYGGLEKYSKSYPSAWQAVCYYDACEFMGEEKITAVYEEYDDTADIKTGLTKIVREKNRERSEDEPFPEPTIKKFILKKVAPGEKEEEKGIRDILLPAAAGVLGIGMLFPLILWFFILTVPLFALKEGETYRYIGQIRLKKGETWYVAYLTKRLIARADLPVFKMKLPPKVRKNSKTGMMQIQCPNGKQVISICGKEVRFTLERE